MTSLLITNGHLVTLDNDNRFVENGSIYIEDRQIADVGDFPAGKYEADRIIDARGSLVMPGLINAHTHIPMTLFRGLADDLELMDWLQNYIFPAEATFVDEEFVVGVRVAELDLGSGVVVDVRVVEVGV